MKTLNQLEKKLMHYMKKALAEYRMIIPKRDRILICLSGGKDSFTLLTLMHKLQIEMNRRFDLYSFTLDQSQPGWNDSALRDWLNERKIPFTILTEDTYSIVTDKIPENKTYCSLCSRLRRGIIYRFAHENAYNKVALGHHRDDLIRTFLMSVLYTGQIKTMPPKLLTDNKRHIVIRPLVFCQEQDIKEYSELMRFPIIPCTLCGSQDNLARVRVRLLIDQLTRDNPKVPSNILRALQNVKPSHLMDHQLWNYKDLLEETAEEIESGAKIESI